MDTVSFAVSTADSLSIGLLLRSQTLAAVCATSSHVRHPQARHFTPGIQRPLHPPHCCNDPMAFTIADLKKEHTKFSTTMNDCLDKAKEHVANINAMLIRMEHAKFMENHTNDSSNASSPTIDLIQPKNSTLQVHNTTITNGDDAKSSLSPESRSDEMADEVTIDLTMAPADITIAPNMATPDIVTDTTGIKRVQSALDVDDDDNTQQVAISTVKSSLPVQPRSEETTTTIIDVTMAMPDIFSHPMRIEQTQPYGAAIQSNPMTVLSYNLFHSPHQY
ncbi:hypothetical protein PVAP13_2KG264916 [Panicum virgatum]|uniref:Uncharacterized protein n=1 Tax=Panicum virgatum TaxID=38727 RepID=A0A8T0W2J2_PANVG|nr:hypothetical protein PVAP13_2KG264916 [Panicum virgatum]